MAADRRWAIRQGSATSLCRHPKTWSLSPRGDAALASLVVLATGGARGITAEVLRGLARPGCCFILVGRSPWPQDEPAETAALPDEAALRTYHVGLVRAGKSKHTPAEIRRLVQATLDARGMRANVADLRAAGATVEYHPLATLDMLPALVNDVVARHGRIDGIVHGAGVIEDKLLADKSSESWSRVVETKVLGMLALAQAVDPATLKFFTVFSSVAGRYGNSGQSDYATANELMNRLAQQLQARWGEGVVVSAFCWGPWGATKFGAGMITAETEAKFAAKGVKLVSAELGRRLFREELTRRAGLPVEVICGEADWDSHEARRGAFVPAARLAPMAPLLGATEAKAQPTGERIIPVHLDPAQHLYLREHMIDGRMVLPAAAALEIMAEAVQVLWPGWKVAEVAEHRLLKGVELDAARELQVLVVPPPYGSSEGFEVSASLQSALPGGRAMTHYRCVVRLEQSLPSAMPHGADVVHDDRSLSVAKAYGEWLFHGPRFQVITDIDGLSPRGASARVRSTRPTQWLVHAENSADQGGGGRPGDDGWCFDPALLDAAAQMAWLWSRAYRDESALPTRFGRVARHVEVLPETAAHGLFAH